MLELGVIMVLVGVIGLLSEAYKWEDIGDIGVTITIILALIYALIHKYRKYPIS